jgi:hypothetical protein
MFRTEVNGWGLRNLTRDSKHVGHKIREGDVKVARNHLLHNTHALYTGHSDHSLQAVVIEIPSSKVNFPPDVTRSAVDCQGLLMTQWHNEAMPAVNVFRLSLKRQMAYCPHRATPCPTKLQLNKLVNVSC